MPSNIICLGNGSTEADTLAKNIAVLHNISYWGFLDNNTLIKDGCYHTSIYDIKPNELMSKTKNIDNLTIIVLDQNKTCYSSDQEFYDTINLAQALSEHAQIEFVDPLMITSFNEIIKINKSFCILPFNSLWVRESDAPRHCCWMTPFKTAYTNFYDNPESNKMRQQMLSGELVDSCLVCYKIEDSGAISERQNQTIQWAHKLGLRSLDDVKNVKLVNYDISLGNKCNLMCRMCNPGSSNLISSEYSRIGLYPTDRGIIDLDNFDIINFDTVQRIQVVGGEPSINDNFYNFLRKCIRHNKTDVEIFVSTNAVAINKEFTELIQNFDNIKFSISIDGFESTNQYIRWPSPWLKIINNIKKLTSVLKPYKYYFNTVVSIYNVFQLFELFKFLEENYPTSAFHITFLYNPSILEAWNFPNKQLALENLNQIKTLKTYQQNQIFKSKIDGIINQLETTDIDLVKLKEFFEFNDKLDQSRGVTLADYIPELNDCRRYLNG
jgi:molybdenum cofactor biosynthesis enzyme MoaA